MILHLLSRSLTLTFLILITLGESQAQETTQQSEQAQNVSRIPQSRVESDDQIESSSKKSIKSNVSNQNEGVSLIKTSPLLILLGDIRLGYEHKLTDNSALDIELGYLIDPFFFRGTLLDLQNSSDTKTYNATIRYKKYLFLTGNSWSSENRLQGLYLAPFAKTIYSSRVIQMANNNLNIQHFIMGADIGVQPQFSMFNLDVFVGVGYDYSPGQEFNQISIPTSREVAYRFGMRIGIDPYTSLFSRSKRNKTAKKRQSKRNNSAYEDVGLSSQGYEGFLIKISPWHLAHGDVRIGLELKLNRFSAIEIEGGRQLSTKTVPIHNTIVRYKIFPNTATDTFLDKSIQGTYLAPFVNYGTSARLLSQVFSINGSNQVNEYALVGADLGYQAQSGFFNIDFFVGAGYSLLKPNRSFVLNEENTGIVFNNSHTAIANVGLRIGFRVGIAPFKKRV